MVSNIGEIVRGTLTVDDGTFNVTYALDQTSGLNRMIREQETPASQLGKRYECAEHLREIRDGKEVLATLTGNVKLNDGVQVYMGCGTVVLCTKSSVAASPAGNVTDGITPGAPYCHDRQMALIEPKRLPSSD